MADTRAYMPWPRVAERLRANACHVAWRRRRTQFALPWLLVNWARSGDQDFLVVALAAGAVGVLTFVVARRLALPPEA